MSANNNPTRHGVVVRPMRLLNATTAEGAGGTVFHLGRAYSAFGLEYFRGTTSLTQESTAATVNLQGQIGSTGTWFNLGATITVNSATPAIARSTNSIPVHRVRGYVSAYTTSAGSSSTSQNCIPITLYVSAGFGSS